MPETRSFEERKAPLRALAHADLLARLDHHEQRMRAVITDVLAGEPDAVIPWTGRQMAVVKFTPHLRNEHAVHRWDVAGDDSTSLALLATPDLTEHSVGVLGAILLVAGRELDPDPDSDFRVRLRSDGQPDLLVTVEQGDATLVWASAGTVRGASDRSSTLTYRFLSPPGSLSKAVTSRSGCPALRLLAGFRGARGRYVPIHQGGRPSAGDRLVGPLPQSL